MIADRGAVLGIDVGFSRTERTTGWCLLTWDEAAVTWRTVVTGSADGVRRAALQPLLENVDLLLAVAIDGPIRPGLVCVREYRCAESLLARGTFQRRGKPGASHVGSGWDLHRAATSTARFIMRLTGVRSDAVVEAFPNHFLAVLHEDDAFPRSEEVQRGWTDVLFTCRSVRAALERLLVDVAPGRTVSGEWDFSGTSRADVHEQRSAFVCALTALCVAATRVVSVGAAADGFIHLPPRAAWGRGAGGGAPWAEVALAENVEAVCSDRVRQWSPLVYSNGCRWLPA